MTEIAISSFMTPFDWQLNLGAILLLDGAVRFRVWAPRVQELSVILPHRGGNPFPLASEGNGYFSGVIAGITEGERYLYLLDGETVRPDPASRFQPEGVHGPSQVVAADSSIWSDNGWKGLPLDEYIIYELHVGTFTPFSTFDGVITRLDYLCELGITAVELMPVAQFPGERNWGYDGVYPFAPHNSYGGPNGLKRLVDACHSKGHGSDLWMWFTTTWVRKGTICTISVSTLPTATVPPGETPSISTVPTVIRSATTSSPMHFTG